MISFVITTASRSSFNVLKQNCGNKVAMESSEIILLECRRNKWSYLRHLLIKALRANREKLFGVIEPLFHLIASTRGTFDGWRKNNAGPFFQHHHGWQTLQVNNWLIKRRRRFFSLFQRLRIFQLFIFPLVGEIFTTDADNESRG